MREKINPLDFAAAVGKVRVLERTLIKSEVFDEANQVDLQEALRFFVEAGGYPEDILHVKNSGDVEEILSREQGRLKKMAGDLLKHETLLRIVELENLTTALSAAQEYGDEFVSDHIRHVIDMHNIKTFLRLYVLKEPVEMLSGMIECDGFVEKQTFTGLYTQDIAAFTARLAFVHKRCSVVDYAAVLKDGIDKLLRENSFIVLESRISSFLMQSLKPAKYLAFGPAAVIAYYFAKVNEIKLIRLVILAKMNGLSPDLVKERLSNVYA